MRIVVQYVPEGSTDGKSLYGYIEVVWKDLDEDTQNEISEAIIPDPAAYLDAMCLDASKQFVLKEPCFFPYVPCRFYPLYKMTSVQNYQVVEALTITALLKKIRENKVEMERLREEVEEKWRAWWQVEDDDLVEIGPILNGGNFGIDPLLWELYGTRCEAEQRMYRLWWLWRYPREKAWKQRLRDATVAVNSPSGDTYKVDPALLFERGRFVDRCGNLLRWTPSNNSGIFELQEELLTAMGERAIRNRKRTDENHDIG